MSHDVLLVPGLWMPAVAMGVLAQRLGRRGYRVRVHRYSGRDAFDRNVEALARSLGGRGAVHLVGHSLGGVLVHALGQRMGPDAIATAVLLGAPVRGCLAGRRFARRGLGRWMMGRSRELWPERGARWPHAAPLGVVAGTRSLGLARLFGRLPGENDGVVQVEETAVDGAADRLRLSVSHSGMIFSAPVAGAVAGFLEHGRFPR